MATFTKPAKIPRWADTGIIVEPPEAKKDAGWLFQEIPPSSFENWKENLTGSWLKWIDERWADGPSADVIAAVDPSGANADPIVELDGITPLRSNFIFRDGGTNSTLRVTKDTQVLQWLVGATQAFSVSPALVVAGASDSDGIRLAGAGTSKAITFDEDLNQIRYNITTDVMSFLCDSATSSLDVHKTHVRVLSGVNTGGTAVPGAGQGTFVDSIHVGSDAIPTAGVSKFLGGLNTGTPANNAAAGSIHAAIGLRVGTGTTAPAAGTGIFSEGISVGFDANPGANRVKVGDSMFGLRFDGTDPFIDADAGDAIQYDRSGDFFDFIIGSSTRMRVTASNVEAGVDAVNDLGSSSIAWKSVHCVRSVPGGTGPYPTPVESRWERTWNNTVTCRAKVLSAGGAHAASWNLSSVSHPGTGQYLITPITSLGTGGHVVCSAERFLSPALLCSGEWDDPAGEVQIRTMFVNHAGGSNDLIDTNTSFAGFN